MRGVFLLLAAGLAGGCGDNVEVTEDGAPPIIDAAPADAAGPDASPAAGPCLDRPGDLPRPPAASGTLPCDLLPPGFGS